MAFSRNRCGPTNSDREKKLWRSLGGGPPRRRCNKVVALQKRRETTDEGNYSFFNRPICIITGAMSAAAMASELERVVALRRLNKSRNASPFHHNHQQQQQQTNSYGHQQQQQPNNYGHQQQQQPNNGYGQQTNNSHQGTKQLWEDPDFPACQASVFYHQAAPLHFQWKRPKVLSV
ncbi:hypothetical protein AAG570_004664 [Ranatra chinensis]|uniref:Uncharacterized protein n=1 Tax=Ranatra chinensis TaxID=642074 RepID=A0ABD0Y1U5_9HEMI